jgi:hypothetical protein
MDWCGRVTSIGTAAVPAESNSETGLNLRMDARDRLAVAEH